MCLLPHSTEVTPSKATKNFPALARVAQWIECGLQTKGLLVQFPVRAHACIAGQVPSGGHVRGNHTWMFLPLLKKKKKKKRISQYSSGLSCCACGFMALLRTLLASFGFHDLSCWHTLPFLSPFQSFLGSLL